ncbi:MAG: hypothetical protein V9E94_20440 [Microthrixaceae bacterium]
MSEHPLICWVDVPAMSPEVAAEADPAERQMTLDLRSLARRCSGLIDHTP